MERMGKWIGLGVDVDVDVGVGVRVGVAVAVVVGVAVCGGGGGGSDTLSVADAAAPLMASPLNSGDVVSVNVPVCVLWMGSDITHDDP